MAFKFYKSPEGIAEYQKTGQEYPDHVQDLMFRHHHQLIDWDRNKREIINSVTRVKLWNGEEYLVWSDTSEGVDKVYGRKHTFYRSNLGRYLKIETQTTRIPNPDFQSNPNMEFDLNDSSGDGKPKDFGNLSPFKEITNVIGEKEAYSLPFTKANLEDLHKRCIDKAANTGELTSYSVSKDIDILFNYGCIPTKSERERIDNMNSMNRFRQTLAPSSSMAKEATMMMEATL